VETFVEKPSAARAETLLSEGCLWNSGMFMVSAATLIDELGARAPKVLAAARAAVDEAETADGVVRLGAAFSAAPKISIDYAVMETTSNAAVVAASFAWSDLGSWSAVLEAGTRDGDGNAAGGQAVFADATNTLVRAEPGVTVVVVGASNLAVIVDQGVVMVCSLDNDAGLKAAVERAQAISG
jgi:mannose-1-phosphate guanylyltransferase